MKTKNHYFKLMNLSIGIFTILILSLSVVSADEKIKTVRLTANNLNHVATEGAIRTQGGQSFNSNPVILSSTSKTQLVNPINLEKGKYKVVIKQGAWSRWDNDIGNSGDWGGGPGLAWESLASVVYNDNNEMNLYRFGVSYSSSALIAENAAKGKSFTLNHDGGNIYLFLDDNPIDDNRGSMNLEIYEVTEDNGDGDNELECEDIDFDCDGKVDVDDKKIASDLFIDLINEEVELNEELINELEDRYDCDTFAEYVEDEWLNSDVELFIKWNALANRFDELEGDMCPVDDDDGNRNRGPRNGFGNTCEENWEFSGWSECSNGSQTRTGYETNECNLIYEGQQKFETRVCEMQEDLSEDVKDGGKGFPWLLLLLIGVVILFIIIIIVMLIR